MGKYNYLESIKDDVRDYINESITLSDFNDVDDLAEHLNDVLWCEDSVTGNASGSYTFNTYKAKENIENCTNFFEIVRNMISEGFYTKESFADDVINEEYEKIDVSVRCYLLSQAITEVLNDFDDDDFINDDDSEDE